MWQVSSAAVLAYYNFPSASIAEVSSLRSIVTPAFYEKIPSCALSRLKKQVAIWDKTCKKIKNGKYLCNLINWIKHVSLTPF